MGFKVFLSRDFKPVPPDRAELVKVVGDDGKIAFYRPNHVRARDTSPDVRHTEKAEGPRIAVPEWAARKLGNDLGVDWSRVDIEQFRMGLEEEQEHAATVNGDMRTMARIALDHIRETPDYYSKLRGAMSMMVSPSGCKQKKPKA